jgi:tetratricopeptide (TPR) repeat protein
VEVDIFDDLRTDPAAIVAGKPASAAAPPAPPREEPLDVPAEDPAVASTVDDGPALLHMAEDALARGDLSGARAGLNNYFAAMAGHEAAIPWQAHQARLRLSIADGKPEAVLEHFEQMLKQGFTPEQARMAETIDAWLSPLADASAALLRVSLLVRTLTYFRQAGDREAMDRTYRQIATAQEATGDERKLVQFLKNHLEIKKVMSDQEGQLDLIDQIGNRLYRLGETEEAKAFYEQGLTLRAQLEGGTAPGATDTDPPPAPADVAATEAGGAAEPDTPAESPVAPPPRKDDA